MPTIIDKLKRHPQMQLTTMQDIGGVRVVVNSIDDVHTLAEEYKSKSRFRHELVGEYNYINEPRSEDGYRSHHLCYKYINNQNSNYNGLRVELQIRTKLQHTWATAVETMGTILGQSLKFRQGEQQWIDFFALTSSAFAHQEKCTPIPRFSHLSYPETKREIAYLESSIEALAKMQAFSMAADGISTTNNSPQAYTYHLIILDSQEKTVNTTAYGRDSYEKALEDLAKAEQKAEQGINIEPVLVSAGKIDTLKRAYPNFFLDVSEFVNLVLNLVDE